MPVHKDRHVDTIAPLAATPKAHDEQARYQQLATLREFKERLATYSDIKQEWYRNPQALTPAQCTLTHAEPRPVPDRNLARMD
ncbi:hypothetical protein L0636_02250 [Halomonas janggokensis]|uniref:Uncharacterized protein n=1 Tax=Vreelandella janggokensis TaxID=370767 RepID=A0ABT4ISV0_9GAMM|nr:hypothetical protein [Halomonas janggokensis]MCZ0926703.1 hypothetical protein [Halomonas janggokensis]MCZ0929241.1 hypothetical protein [Halomonas janggokensis]